MKLVVVICTHNRSSLLMKTIESLNFAAKPDDVDIFLLVIANACSDDTMERLSEYQQSNTQAGELSLTFEEEPKRGKSHALNRAIAILSDGYLCFVDDDHRVDRNYFSAIAESIKNYPYTQVFCGKIIPDWTGEEPDWIHLDGKYRIYPLPIPDFQMGEKAVRVDAEGRLPGGGNLIVHRTVFDRVGEFSTELGPKGHNLLGSEDSDFVLRALAMGTDIQYIPTIVQYHYVDLNRLKMEYLLKKSFQRTRSIALTHYPNSSSVPPYLFKKLAIYLGAVLFCFNRTKMRFYLMRLAATLGEIRGMKDCAH